MDRSGAVRWCLGVNPGVIRMRQTGEVGVVTPERHEVVIQLAPKNHKAVRGGGDGRRGALMGSHPTPLLVKTYFS